MNQAEILDVCRQAAATADIPVHLLVACCIAESNLNPSARRPSFSEDDQRFWPDVSFGLGQQTVRWAPEYNGGGSWPGKNEVERVGALYVNPVHAAKVAAENLSGKWMDSKPDMFAALCKYNWPQGKGKPASPSIEANYRRGLNEAAKLLGEQMTPAYNPDYPVRTQDHDWDCFEESANWGLHALGRNPSSAWLEQQMLADGIESKDVGLLDGSGKQASLWITRQYGDPAEGTPTITAYNASSVNFDDVRSVAGTTAVLIGGHRWGSAGHWTGVRRYDRSADVLVLANPGGNGPVYGLTSLDRQQFAARGPWSMVVLRAGDTTPTPTPDTRIERVKTKLTEALAILEEKP